MTRDYNAVRAAVTCAMLAPADMSEKRAKLYAGPAIEENIGRRLWPFEVGPAMQEFLRVWRNREADRRLHATGHLSDRELEEVRRNSLRGLDSRR